MSSELGDKWVEVVNHVDCEVWSKESFMDSDVVEIPSSMLDFILVLEEGAKKYSANEWLFKGVSLDRRSNHASMSRHLAEYFMGMEQDPETGLDPLLHIAARALMAYAVRDQGNREALEEETGLDY